MRRSWLALIAGLIVGTTLTITGGGSANDQGAPSTKTQEPVVTPVAGPSWLNRLGLTYRESSLGRGSATYGPPPTDSGSLPTQRPSQSIAALPIGRPVMLSGADLYRLNCQSCHRAEGTGSPPEIKSVLGLVQGSSIELVRQHLQQEGKAAAGSAAHAQATRARADLYQRIQKGGQRMPALAHLQEADIDVLYAYLTQLAGSPDASPQLRRTASWARLGEHVVKGTCHICHDAVGPRPSAQALLITRNDSGVYDAARGQASRRFRDEGPQRRGRDEGRSGVPLPRADAGVFVPARCGSGRRVHVSGRLPAASRRLQGSVARSPWSRAGTGQPRPGAPSLFGSAPR